MNNFKQKFTKCIESNDFYATAITAVIVAAVVLVNVIVYTLAVAFGWYFTPARKDDLSISGSGETLFAEAIEKGLEVEVIFCMYEKDVEAHDTGSFVLQTAREFANKYPDTIKLKFVN